MSSKINYTSSNHKSGRTVVALILDGYKQYCDYGYPKDPKIYVIRAEPKTLKKISEYIESLLFTDGGTWEFQQIEDRRLLSGQIFFGPEQIEIKMEL